MSKSAKSAAPFPMFNGEAGFPVEFYRENLDRFIAMAGDMGNLSREGMSAAAEAAQASAKGVQELNARAFAYLQDAMSSGMEVGKSVASAKTVQEAVELQTSYTKTALESYMSQMSDMASLMASTMREAAEPLQAHAGQVVEKFQSAK